MDALGYVNNTLFFRYLEEARIQYLNKIGIKQLMTEYGLGFVVAFIDCKFILSLTYPDTVYIGTRITEISATGLHFAKLFTTESIKKLRVKAKVLLFLIFVKISTSKSFPQMR